MKQIQKPEHVLFVCTGKACSKKGKYLKKEIKHWLKENHLKHRIKVIKTECTDNCKLAPVTCLMPENEWFSKHRLLDFSILNKCLGICSSENENPEKIETKEPEILN